MSTRIPSLGPRGEGWVALQIVLMAGVVLGAAFRLGREGETAELEWLTVIGRIVLVAAVALIVWAYVTLRAARSLSAMPKPIPGGSLVDVGPYRWVRHPLYLGLILAGVGTAASRLSLVSLVAAIALAVVLDLKRRREEAWLTEQYAGYSAYRARTKALIPLVY